MTNPLKELLEQLGVHVDADGFGCTVEQEVANLRSGISDIPTKESRDRTVIQFGLRTIRKAAKELIKNARKLELELEMRMLDKPDDVNLGAEENQHLSLHLEEEQLRAEGARREGQALLRFCDLVESHYDESLN